MTGKIGAAEFALPAANRHEMPNLSWMQS